MSRVFNPILYQYPRVRMRMLNVLVDSSSFTHVLYYLIRFALSAYAIVLSCSFQ